MNFINTFEILENYDYVEIVGSPISIITIATLMIFAAVALFFAIRYNVIHGVITFITLPVCVILGMEVIIFADIETFMNLGRPFYNASNYVFGNIYRFITYMDPLDIMHPLLLSLGILVTFAGSQFLSMYFRTRRLRPENATSLKKDRRMPNYQFNVKGQSPHAHAFHPNSYFTPRNKNVSFYRGKDSIELHPRPKPLQFRTTSYSDVLHNIEHQTAKDESLKPMNLSINANPNILPKDVVIDVPVEPSKALKKKLMREKKVSKVTPVPADIPVAPLNTNAYNQYDQNANYYQQTPIQQQYQQYYQQYPEYYQNYYQDYYPQYQQYDQQNYPQDNTNYNIGGYYNNEHSS